MSRRFPSNVKPVQFFPAADQGLDAGPQSVEAGGARGADAVLYDLTIRNLVRAVVDGGLGARWEQGDDRDRAQLDALWAVEELRGPLVVALAEAVNDSGVVVTTDIRVRL